MQPDQTAVFFVRAEQLAKAHWIPEQQDRQKMVPDHIRHTLKAQTSENCKT